MRAETIDRFNVPVDTRSPTGQTNAYLVTGASPAASGSEPTTILVDPAGRTDALDAAIETSPGALDHIVTTHAHPDHVGGLVHYGMVSAADVWGVAGEVHRLAAETDVYPARTFRDGHTIGPLTAIATPGHAADHVAFQTELADGRRAILCGDLAIEPGSIYVGGPDGDMAAYLRSLRHLCDRDPDVLYPGHGAVIDDPIDTIDRLIDHRLDRERRILAAIDAGATAPDDVVDRAYEKDLTGVADLARRTVVCHIEKLADEGHVEWNPETETIHRIAE
ncbi:MAG: MBL fold metallo-hydrolase [Halobacteriota archaeon]